MSHGVDGNTSLHCVNHGNALLVNCCLQKHSIRSCRLLLDSRHIPTIRPKANGDNDQRIESVSGLETAEDSQQQLEDIAEV